MDNDQFAEPDLQVHETAILEPGAKVGSGTKIWHQAHVRTGAQIGSACTISKNVFVDAGAVIGDECSIQNNVSVYKGVTLGNRVFVGPSAVFTNDLLPRAHSTDWRVVPTVVGNGVSIGANATIICGNSLADFCMIGAGSVVTKDVKAHQLVVGNPAAHIGWVCDCGEVVSSEVEAPAELRCDRHRSKGEV